MSLLDDFTAWQIAAKPGQRFEYHRGYIARQVTAGNPYARPIVIMCRAVIAAYLTGNFELVQQRHGTDDYSYFIVRRGKRDENLRLWAAR